MDKKEVKYISEGDVPQNQLPTEWTQERGACVGGTSPYPGHLEGHTWGIKGIRE